MKYSDIYQLAAKCSEEVADLFYQYKDNHEEVGRYFDVDKAIVLAIIVEDYIDYSEEKAIINIFDLIEEMAKTNNRTLLFFVNEFLEQLSRDDDHDATPYMRTNTHRMFLSLRH